ncbi:MAG: hypothetical protein FJ386_10175 [Verrucomicrobia bacterium]|nr:hypothetical protein [Verrucomicrobiota bacterium]
MKTIRIWLASSVLAAACAAPAQDKVFSGPQPGEKVTPFKVVTMTGADAGKERDFVADFKGAPTVFVFVHGVERSMTPLLTVVDQYASERKETLRCAFVFLDGDRVNAGQRIPAVAGSLRLKSPVTLSVDGAEGPGNYGLNKQCLLTLVIAKDNKVTANFALVQPGIADAPAVLKALGSMIGDASPPDAEALRERRMAELGAGKGRPAADGAMRMRPAELDLSKLDLGSERALRAAVQALTNEVVRLRAELAAARGSAAGTAKRDPAAQPKREAPKGELPGAAPTDPRLLEMLRAFIQPGNDKARVDAVLKEVEDYVKGNTDLTKQAVDGWVRVLHLKYGTEYAHAQGQKMVDRFKK